MDSLINAAARALAAGDPLGALNLIALRDDAPALALRGIAMAQLGELARAKLLLRNAARAFGPGEFVARARCIVAAAEIAFAARELNLPANMLESAQATLELYGDVANATHASYILIRRDLLIGRIAAAELRLSEFDPARLPPAARTVHELIVAGIAIRRLSIKPARQALSRAARAARAANIPALDAEVETAEELLSAPAARLITPGGARLLRLDQVEALQASRSLIVDGCRLVVRRRGVVIPLARRPVLFTLARALAEAWPEDVSRAALVSRAFRGRRADESHRARLRVEIGRLRKILHPVAGVNATDGGFALLPRGARDVVVIAPPSEESHDAVLAFLADGASWSSSALGLVLGQSQRTVQRSLDALMAAGKALSFGRGRARRWTTPPMPGFTTTLLLPAPLPVD